MTALDELDKLAAEKVMGWKSVPGPLSGTDAPYTQIRLPTKIYDVPRFNVEDWQPTRNIAQAWECLEKLGLAYLISSLVSGQIEASIFVSREVGYLEASAMVASEAIVRACLKAKGIDV